MHSLVGTRSMRCGSLRQRVAGRVCHGTITRPSPRRAPSGMAACRRAVIRAALVTEPGHTDGSDENNGQKWKEFMQLARIHNMIPSVLLVMVGAWAGAGHRFSVLGSYHVWLMSLLSGGVAVASVVVNDYFDYKVDVKNAPHKPLPSGAIAPDVALLLSSVIYCAVLIIACLMEPSGLRSIIAFSAAATLLYTPVFKKLTAIKNATVATVIALAPVAGALAAGAGEMGLRNLLPATIFAFSGVMYREIVMDLNDLEGDKAAGVWTLPALLGKPAALLTAVGIFLAGNAAAFLQLSRMEAGRELAAVLQNWFGLQLVVSQQLAVTAPLLIIAWAVWQVTRSAWGVWSNGFDAKAVGVAVDACLKPIGLGMVLLAAAT